MTAVVLVLNAALLACAALACWMARTPVRPVQPVQPAPAPPSAESPPRTWVAPGWMLLAGPAEALRIVRRRRATYRIERVA